MGIIPEASGSNIKGALITAGVHALFEATVVPYGTSFNINSKCKNPTDYSSQRVVCGIQDSGLVILL